MDEHGIRSRIEFLIDKSKSKVEIDEVSYGEVLHGAASIMTLVYGPASKQLAALDRSIADEKPRLSTTYPEAQRAILAKVAAGALAGTLAELDRG